MFGPCALTHARRLSVFLNLYDDQELCLLAAQRHLHRHDIYIESAIAGSGWVLQSNVWRM
jgi:hypothetical protein